MYMFAMEYRILAANAGRELTHEHLRKRIGGERGDSLWPMRKMVAKLPRKLGDYAEDPTYIFTQLRLGCRIPKGEREGRRRNPRQHPEWKGAYTFIFREIVVP